MQKLPDSLLENSNLFWPSPDNVSMPTQYDARDITVVTSFFDLGRSDWKAQRGKPSAYRRPLDVYFDYFAHLAMLKNPMVIFVAPEHAERVLQIRRANGLENITTIYTIAHLFEIDKIKALAEEFKSKMTPMFRGWVRFPNVPEFNEPKYAVLDSLKSIFVNTAIKANVVPTKQVAWLDFGYARNERCFDCGKPWRFDVGGKINLFHMRPIDDMPVFKVLQRGYVYFQGGCKVGPVEAWPAFSASIDHALAGLLQADLFDDEQTLLLMAWRANPELYHIHPLDRRDWRVAIRNFNEHMQGEDVQFRDYRFINRLKESGPGKGVRSLAAKVVRGMDKFT